MALIEKMAITGIRSYNPNDISVIEFQTPLTMIVGTNGSGKTTIIECLKYATSGDLPPGSKNSAFVHDPKVAGEKEVKAQVKLRFTDVVGKRHTVSRTMLSSQKAKKIETKSLDSVIMKEVNGEVKSITSRCADMNREMISRLGVSKAVLDNVIFCHQEEANWPLSEGKVLKMKFDEIFAATRYIKALESIRIFRKEQAVAVKNCVVELDYLEDIKKDTEKLKSDLLEKESKIEVIRDDIRKKEKQAGPVEEELTEIDAIQAEVIRLERHIGVCKSSYEQLVKNGKEVKERIVEKFTGTYDDLLNTKEEFHKKVTKDEARVRQIEERIKSHAQEIQRLSADRTELLTKHGKLVQEAESHERRICSRDEQISALIKQYQLSDLPPGPYDRDQVNEFLTALRMYYRCNVEEAEKKKAEFTKKLDETSKKTTNLTKSHYDYESKIKHRKDSMEDNRKKLRQISEELANVAASGNLLQGIERDLRKSEKELEYLRTQTDANQLNKDIETLTEEKKECDQALVKLRDEQNRMHLQSTVQTKIDMKVKEKQGKEDSIQSILSRHEMDLSAIFDSRPPLEDLKSKLMEYSQAKRMELRGISDKLKSLEKQLASKEADRKLNLDNLRKIEGKIAVFKQKLDKACGENDYNMYREQVTKSLDKYKNIISEIKAFEKIYRKYISEMKGIQSKGKGCPLCHREFGTAKELHQLIDELEHKLASVPEKKLHNESLLEEESQRLSTIDELAPIKVNLENLERKEVPEVNKRVKELSKEMEELRVSLADLEDTRALIESEERTARDIEPDVKMIDAYLYEIKDIDRTIDLESSKLKGITPGRTLTKLTTEIQEMQEQIESIERKLELKRNQSRDFERQCSVLERTTNDLKSQKLDITSKLQRRSQLEDQKADLTAANCSFEREIREAERQLEPIQRTLSDLRQQKLELEDSKEKHAEEVRSALESIKQSGNKVRELDAEVVRYINEGKEHSLLENQREVEEIETKNSDLEQQKEKLSGDLASIRKHVDSQKTRERDLEDNIRLFEIEEEIKKKKQELAGLKKELIRYGNSTTIKERKIDLQCKLDKIRKTRDNLEGRLKGFEDSREEIQKTLSSKKHVEAVPKYRKKMIEVKTTEMANQDLDNYYKALDRAIIKFHTMKMAEINRIIKEYWIHTYKGHDIDTIEIRADEDAESGATKARRTYNYRVVMVKGQTALDMRGRCSAGQKVLASILIRLALAETFCLNCGILALDEPTTNLDEHNIESLANALKDIIISRQQQRNFQLLVITHDEDFVRALGQSDYVDHFYRVYKDESSGYSTIHRRKVAEMNE